MHEGSSLYLYSNERNDFIGALNEKNTKNDFRLSTRPLRGNELILELVQPLENKTSDELILKGVGQAFIPLKAKGFGASGACHQNVICKTDEVYQKTVNLQCLLLMVFLGVGVQVL